MTLASLADAPAAAEWRSLVEKTLKGQPLDTLVSATAEGLPIAPLYLPGEGPRTALALPARDAERPWDLRAAVAHPDPARANADLLADLKGGAASALVRIDPTGAAGVAVGSAAGLEAALKDIILEIAPVALDAGFLGPQAADWLAGVARGSPSAKLNFHMDPLGALAA
ncbi:MAG: methylmalonyl-CoA mutase, partial [Phenylobacterium sp.]|nr:methylmalonyl-CoA mutase [Phenylobacterium sp.]